MTKTILAALIVLGCASAQQGAPVVQAPSLPANDSTARARLTASSRHGEYVKIDAGGGDSVRLWVVYPERRDKAPVVVVIQEIYGLSDWLRGVGDQLAADGFIAVVPDLLSGKAPGGAGSDAVDAQGAVALTRTLTRDEWTRRLNAAARYGRSLPAASGRVGSVGFCWGGSRSFEMAAALEGNGAAVVYYGSSPDSTTLAAVRAPVLGLYGADDARVNATVPGAQAAMQRMNKEYTPVMFEGAGHGFLRDQTGRNGANMRAAEAAWPRTIAFFREKLGR